MPRLRGAALVGLAEALATGKVVLAPGASDPAEAYEALCRRPGLGPWTAGYIIQRALGAPDVLLATDLGVRKAAARLGLPDAPVALAQRAEAWRPWRSYAMHHLWSTLA
jgi:AraC family transcriptional regulator of adaptative response / DNA-3-methyladenine glycosylase II